MKKCLLVLLGILWTSLTCLFAEHVPVEKALQVATRFTQQTDGNLRSGQLIQLAYSAKPSLRAASQNTYYYVFNKGDQNGYIIIAGDDRAHPVLGYSDSGTFSYGKIPDNMKAWLQGYADQIRYACTNAVEQAPEIGQEWDALLQSRKLPGLRAATQLTTAKWNQYDPYNRACPKINEAATLTGCVATAMGIVMKYHGHPARGTGSATTEKGNYTADFNVNYLWDKMLMDYDGQFTVENADAVATLLYHCGVSCNMKYGISASGAQTGQIINALTQYFDYDKSIAYVQKEDYSASEWETLLQNEIVNQHRPVVYSGSGTGGHAFVFDGYNGNAYSVNWGWGGYLNGWFTLSALTPGGDNYTYDQSMVIHIFPNAGGSYLNEARITELPSYTGGMKVSGTPVQGTRFTLTVSALRGISPAFNAEVSVAHYDKNKRMKNLVSSAHNLNFSPSSTYYNLTYSCTITDPIEEGDVLYLVSKTGSEDYKIIGGRPGIVTAIDLTGSSPSGTCHVTWNAVQGLTVVPSSGYNANSIAKGGDFKFTITNKTGKKVIVTNGSTTLVPNASGVYTLSNIQNDIQLVLALGDDLTYKLTTNTLNGVSVVPENGYDASSIVKGGDFKFKIENNSGKKIVVKNGSIVLTPDNTGVYTIRNVQADIQLTLAYETTYKISWNTLTNVTVIPEPGYDAASVSKGDDFKFKLDNKSGKGVIVKKSSTVLTPDNAGVYTLPNVSGNTRLTLAFETIVSYKVTLPIITGFDIQAAPGYNASSVAAGADFKFIVTPEAGYENYTVQIKVNGVSLSSADGTTYIIQDIKTDQVVEMEVFPPSVGTIYKIISSVDPGAAFIPESGYNANAVSQGNDFKFHVVLESYCQDWELAVQVDGEFLQPDSKGVYTISNVKSDKKVIITLKEVFTVTYVKPKEDIKIIVESGYNAGRIVAGGNFAFRLESSYQVNQLTVSANGKVLTPRLSVYTITNIQADQTITVQVNDVGNEKISKDNVSIQVRENKICITHPDMKNVPVYVVSFGGTLSKVDKLNGIYTELDVPGKGVYIISFEGFSGKVMIR